MDNRKDIYTRERDIPERSHASSWEDRERRRQERERHANRRAKNATRMAFLNGGAC